MSPRPLHPSPALLAPPIIGRSVPSFSTRASRRRPMTSWTSPSTYLEHIQSASAGIMMTAKENSATDAGIADSSLITVNRSLVRRDDDPVVVDVNGARSMTIPRMSDRRMTVVYGSARYRETDAEEVADIDVFGVFTDAARRSRR